MRIVTIEGTKNEKPEDTVVVVECGHCEGKGVCRRCNCSDNGSCRSCTSAAGKSYHWSACSPYRCSVCEGVGKTALRVKEQPRT